MGREKATRKRVRSTSYTEPVLATVSAPVIDVRKREAKYYAFDDDKYRNGTFKIIACGDSLDEVIAEAKRSKKAFRIFQHNSDF